MQPSELAKNPCVKLGASTYELRFRLSDLKALAKEGIDLASPDRVEVKGFAALERLATIISFGIAHVVAMTPDQVMEHIDAPEVPLYTLAVIEAQKKASSGAQEAQKKIEAMMAANQPKNKAAKDPAVQ